ncbi:MAG TPA: flagellar basal body rod protein FlgC [Candidatus Nitrosotenuis sp.]|jgi:flagellar basal-body rod protein FlgC|nr:flagellar basal body rod protein FlgC [Candidatus Nitrosotenuis sp.]
MKFFQTFDIAASGMTAERFRMDVISNNIANANTSNTLAGTPYRRQVAMVTPQQQAEFESEFAAVSFEDEESGFSGRGVKVAGVAEDQSDFRWVYDPGNPMAQKDGPHKGYVAMPNVNIITEMTSMIAASRGYEANATVVEAAKGMAMKALEIGKSG